GLFPIYSHAQSSFSGNIVQNGSFEQDTGPSSDPIPPWHYTEGLLMSAGGFQAENGINCVGLFGEVYQAVPTTVGQTYLLSFYVAGWAPRGPLPGTYNLDILWNGNMIGTTSFDVTDETFDDMGWSYRSFSVLGTGGT